ncbi:MAG: cyclic nucleotide-binding domain-containing protein [Nitrospirae bacterium]|nr:cyclic nucleotide-binding domain-containing protein [Nitrospirota bacterium]
MLTVQELTSQTLLEGLDNAELEKLLPMVSMVRLLRDEHVFREKGICKGIHMVKSGRIEISKTTTDGWKQPLVIVTPGSFIGEIATLEKTDHATDARALENTELVLFSKEAFTELEKKEPHCMLKIIKNIAIVSALNVRRMNEKFLKALVNY